MSGAGRISLLVSDIDGTLVTDDKRLSEANIGAAARLKGAGVALSLVSSRPPAGFAMLTGPLRIEAPFGAFNGGTILNPDFSVVAKTLVPEAAARTAVAAFVEFGIDGWLFTDDAWYVTDADGAYVAKERKTIAHEPAIVPSLDPFVGEVGKLVGSSSDFDRVAACEAALQARLGSQASARRSQRYYLDVTPYGSGKDEAVRRIAAALGIPLWEVAVIGDMANDIPMFDIAGRRIAMGNAIEDLKRMADFVTEDNEHDGFAAAVDRFVLPRAALVTSA